MHFLCTRGARVFGAVRGFPTGGTLMIIMCCGWFGSATLFSSRLSRNCVPHEHDQSRALMAASTYVDIRARDWRCLSSRESQAVRLPILPGPFLLSPASLLRHLPRMWSRLHQVDMEVMVEERCVV